MSVLGKLVVALGIDRKDYSSGLSDAANDAESFGSTLSNSLGGIGQVALGVGVAGVAVLGKGIVDAVSSASEAQEVFAQTQAVIKSTGGAAGKSADQMAQLASSLSAASGKSRFGDEAILQGENLLATFTNIKGASFDLATGAMVDLATAMGTDVSGGAIQLGKALNDPIAGISALSRVGVSFTDSQKAVIKQLQDTGDMAGAQKIILDELNKEFGGSAAAAASTFAGKMDTLKDKFGELLESAGTKLLPFITQFVDTLNSDAVQGAISGFIDLISNGIGAAIEYVGPIINNVSTFVQNLATQLQSGNGQVGTIATSLGSTLKPILADVGSFIANDLVPAVSNLAKWFMANLPTAITTATDIFNNVLLPIFKSFGDLIFNHVVPALAPLADWFMKNLPVAIAATVEIWNNVLYPGLKILATFIATTLLPTIGNVVDWLAKNVPIAISKASDFVTGTLIPAFISAYNYINNNVIPTVKSIYNWFITNVPAAVQKVSDFFNSTLMPAFSKVSDYINTNLVPIFDKVSNIVMPLFQNETEKAGKLWNNVLLPAFTAVKGFIDSSVIPVFNTFNSKINDVQLAGGNLLNSSLKPLGDFLNNTFSAALGLVRGDIDKLFNSFNSIISVVSSVLDWIQKLIDKLNAIEIPSILQQHSPSPLEQSILDTGNALRAAAGYTTDFNRGLSGVHTPTTGGNTDNRSIEINIDARGQEADLVRKIKQVVNDVIQGNVNSANLSIRVSGG